METQRTLLGPATAVVVVTAALLSIPLVAMQLGTGVNWTGLDFAVAGAMLLVAGFAWLALSRAGDTLVYRAASALAVGSALFLTWANLAVGVIGDPGDAINVAYFGVLAVGVAGAAIARFRPRGMAATMGVMAVAQALVAVVALAFGLGPSGEGVQVVAVNAMFVLLFAASAGLFREAARSRSARRAA